MNLINTEVLERLIDKMVSDRLADLEVDGGQGPEYMTAKQAAEYLGLSKSSFWRLRQENPIGAYYYGQQPHFKRSDIDQWAEQFK